MKTYMNEDYILTIKTDLCTDSMTTFRDFMKGLRTIVYDVYGRTLPDNDYEAIKYFKYAGTNDDKDKPFQERYAYYHQEQCSYTCICSHKIENLHFIVPIWSKENCLEPQLVVGSKCIKRFRIQATCKVCNNKYYIKSEDDIADTCRNCSKCCCCRKKKTNNEQICNPCRSNLKNNLQHVLKNRFDLIEENKKKHNLMINRFIRRRCRRIIDNALRSHVQKFVIEYRRKKTKQKVYDLKKLDEKQYPRTSILLRFWDKPYEYVYEKDRYNPYHPNTFKTYVQAKLKCKL